MIFFSFCLLVGACVCFLRVNVYALLCMTFACVLVSQCVCMCSWCVHVAVCEFVLRARHCVHYETMSTRRAVLGRANDWVLYILAMIALAYTLARNAKADSSCVDYSHHAWSAA